ncbi:hypothetical protein PMAYCL1PPCAC_22258, partial [Pristionchus mayeri]
MLAIRKASSGIDSTTSSSLSSSLSSPTFSRCACTSSSPSATFASAPTTTGCCQQLFRHARSDCGSTSSISSSHMSRLLVL